MLKETAWQAWKRAAIASHMRHEAEDNGNKTKARRLAYVKATAIRQAISLAPDNFMVRITGGIVGIECRGNGTLHLPLDLAYSVAVLPLRTA